MTQAQASAAIFKRWIDQWPGLSGNVPYSTDNNVATVAAASAYARIQIDSMPSEQQTLGPRHRRRYLRRGMINVRLAGPLNVGRGPLDTLAGYVRTIFEGVRLGGKAGDDGITTYSTSVREDRKSKDATQSFVLIATTPFDFVERN